MSQPTAPSSPRFGVLLRSHRLAAGWTQEELAERAQISVGAINTLERGTRRAPHHETIRRLCEALALPADERARLDASARGRDILLTPNAPSAPSAPVTPGDPRPAGEPAPEARAAGRHDPAWAAPLADGEPPPPRFSSRVAPPDTERPPAARLPVIRIPAWTPPHARPRTRIKRLSSLSLARLVGLLILISVAVIGAHPPAATTPVPVRGGAWIVDLQKDPSSLIPNGDGDAYDSNELVDEALYLPLFYGDAHGELHPGAAREVPTVRNGEISADATRWTFRLRPGLVWSDGQPYDARDVDYSWRLWSNPAYVGDFPLTNNPVPHELIRSTSVSPDHLAITFHLSQPYAPFLAAWVDGVQAPLPAHHFSALAPGQVLTSPDELRPTVTSGPFLLRDSQPGDHYTLVRNPRYYLARQGLPYLDTLTFRVGSAASIAQDFQAGAVDLTQLDKNNAQAFQYLRGYHLVVAPTSASFEALVFNFRNTVLATHPEVREAIARAIDRQALIDGPLQGLATALCVDHPSALHPGYQPGAYCPAYGVAAANQVLEDAGWVRGADGVRARDGARLEFEYATTANPDSWRNAAPLLVQRDLLAIGIKLDIETYPGHQFFYTILASGRPSPPSGALAGRFDIAEYGWVYGYDGDDSVLLACAQTWPRGFNLGAYCNPTLDALLQQELATPDPGLRQNLFDQIHQIEVTDVPFVVLFSPLVVTVVHTGTHNYAPSPFIGDTNSVWAWWCNQSRCASQ